MSVRLAYLEREGRGVVLRQVRLAGQGIDERFPAPGSPPPTPGERGIEEACRWVASALASSRASGRLEWVILDSDGAVCSWIASASSEPAYVRSLVRFGPAREGDDLPLAAGSPLAFFAPDEGDSSIDALPSPDDMGGPATALGDAPGSRSLWRRRAPQPAPAEGVPKRGIIAGGDLAARVVVDCLDAHKVSVASCVSLWHALAQAWDPSGPLAPGAGQRAPGTDVGQDAPTTGVVLVDPAHAAGARLVWSWSVAGRLIAGGSQRLRSGKSPEGSPLATIAQPDAARLVSDWLAWSAQIGASPQRIVCVVPEDSSGSLPEFARALGAGWNGVSVDVLATPDPIGTTLQRLAAGLERTPEGGVGTEHATLRALSTRPGRAHRGMHLWFAALLAGCAGVAGFVAYRVRETTASVRLVADQWQAKAKEQVDPRAFESKLRRPADTLKELITQKERLLTLPPDIKPARPILREFETMSLVACSGDYEIVRFDISNSLANLVVRARSLKAGEDLAIALQAISGSSIGSWEPPEQSRRDASPEYPYQWTYRGRWKDAGGSP